jgi:hypothetical protein
MPRGCAGDARLKQGDSHLIALAMRLREVAKTAIARPRALLERKRFSNFPEMFPVPSTGTSNRARPTKGSDRGKRDLTLVVRQRVHAPPHSLNGTWRTAFAKSLSEESSVIS